MINLFNDYGIEISSDKLKMFETYYKLLIEYNNKFNITAITEKREVYLKHFIDSVLGDKFIKNGTLIDIGSGGGFPAIPLKIINDNISLTMVEATGKKCEFLKVIVNALGLKNVTVVNGRAEDIVKLDGFREGFDYCTARAVARLNSLCEYCLPFVKVGGYFIAFKGDANEEIVESKNAIKILGGAINRIEEYKLDGASRTLIEIKKIHETDKKYPRGNGKERKNPL